MASRMRSCSAENEKSILHHCGDFRIVEAELDQDFPRVLAKARHAAADLAAATPIRPDGKLGEASFHRLPLLQMDELRGLAGLEAEIERHVVLFQQTDPVLRRPGKENVLQQFRQRIAVHTAFLIAGKALVGKLRDDADEVLPEVLFEDAERQAPAVRGLEDVVDREEMRSRIDVRVEAVAPRGHETRRLEQRTIQVCTPAYA